MWATEVRPVYNDTAYTTVALPPHTDGCYWDDQPGLQVFQCLQPDLDGGGKTVLVDGFKIAAVMRERFPESFKYWCNQPVPFHHIDDETDHRTTKKVRASWQCRERRVG
jgi:hypothetical protein